MMALIRSSKAAPMPQWRAIDARQSRVQEHAKDGLETPV
jgi:hypothetical protein